MMDSNSVQERFAQVVARTPDAIAVSSPADAVTYAELDERANRMARQLLGLGVRPEDPVMVLQERSVEMVASILGHRVYALYLPRKRVSAAAPAVDRRHVGVPGC
jgi:non-ribosomal peptide synthetase component F